MNILKWFKPKPIKEDCEIKQRLKVLECNHSHTELKVYANNIFYNYSAEICISCNFIVRRLDEFEYRQENYKRAKEELNRAYRRFKPRV